MSTDLNPDYERREEALRNILEGADEIEKASPMRQKLMEIMFEAGKMMVEATANHPEEVARDLSKALAKTLETMENIGRTHNAADDAVIASAKLIRALHDENRTLRDENIKLLNERFQ